MSDRRLVPIRVLAGALIAVLALTACSTVTDGSGSPAPGAPSASPRRSASAGGQSGAASLPSTATPSSPSSEPTTSSAQAAPSRPVRTATVHAGTVTYHIDVWVETTDTDCATHAYGAPVIDYLTAHPCRTLTRLIATTKVRGKDVGFNQSSVSFAGRDPEVYTTAGRFQQLVSRNGTGNIDDLLREGRRLPSGPTGVPSPDAFSALAQDAVVTIVDAWYLDGPTPDNDPPLVKMAQDIYLQY